MMYKCVAEVSLVIMQTLVQVVVKPTVNKELQKP
jgi:hypothetical protein